MSPRDREPRGFALMLVMILLATCTIIAWTVLSTTALNANAQANLLKSTQAQLYAESGIDLAIQHLRNPDNAPEPIVFGAFGDWHWSGVSNVKLDPELPDAFMDVAVQNIGVYQYRITAVGRVGVPGHVITRTRKVDLQVVSRYPIRHGLATNGNISQFFNLKINAGGARVDGSVSGLLSLIVGNKYAGSAPLLSGWASLPTSPTTAVPIPADITYLQSDTSYRYNGAVYNADPLNTTAAASLTTPYVLNPTVSNPAGVYYATGDVEIGKDVTINGTLIVKSGSLKLLSKARLAAKPKSNLPAVVIGGHLKLWDDETQLIADGTVYVGNHIRANGGNGYKSQIKIKGGLLIAGTGASWQNPFTADDFTMEYLAANREAPDLSRKDRVIDSVSVLNWNVP